MKARVLWQSCVVAALGCVGSGVALAQSAVDCSAVAEDMARLKCYDEQAARQKKQVAARPTAASPAAPAPSGAAPAAAESSTTYSPPAAAASSTPASPSTAATSSTPAASPAAAARPTMSPPSVATAAPAPARTSSANDFGLNVDAIRRRQAAANPDAPKEPDQIVARVKAVASKPRGEYRITLEDGQVWEETQHSSNNLAPNVGETVTIKRGMLGSYFLSHSAGLALRVKRTD